MSRRYLPPKTPGPARRPRCGRCLEMRAVHARYPVGDHTVDICLACWEYVTGRPFGYEELHTRLPGFGKAGAHLTPNANAP